MARETNPRVVVVVVDASVPRGLVLERRSVNGELNSRGGGFGAEVVHAGFEASTPGVEMPTEVCTY